MTSLAKATRVLQALQALAMAPAMAVLAGLVMQLTACATAEPACTFEQPSRIRVQQVQRGSSPNFYTCDDCVALSAKTLPSRTVSAEPRAVAARPLNPDQDLKR